MATFDPTEPFSAWSDEDTHAWNAARLNSQAAPTPVPVQTPATTKQLNFIRGLLQQQNMTGGTLDVHSDDAVHRLPLGDLMNGGGFYMPPSWLDKRIASQLIGQLKDSKVRKTPLTGGYAVRLWDSPDVSAEFQDVADNGESQAPKIDPGSLDHIEVESDSGLVIGVDMGSPDGDVTAFRDPATGEVGYAAVGIVPVDDVDAEITVDAIDYTVTGKPNRKQAKKAARAALVPETKHAVDVSAVINNVMHQAVLGDVDEAERILVAALQQAIVHGGPQTPAEPTEQVQTVFITVDQQGREVAPLHTQTKPIGTKPVRDLWPHVLGKAKGADTYGLPVWDATPALRPIQYDVSALHDKNDLRTVCQVIQGGGHLWLSGQKGTGKTTFAMSIAQVCHRPFFRIQHHAQTEALDLLGSKGLRSGETVFEPGILLTAMQAPGAVILLDEPTLASLTLSVYQSILDEGFIQLDDRICRLAPGVTFICADNTSGSGDTSMIYHGTAPVNAAFLDRFDAMIKMDYLPLEAETRQLAFLTGLPAAKCRTICTYAVKVRDAVHAGSIAEPISFRRLVAFAKALRAGVPKPVALANTILSFVVSPSDRETYVQLASGHL